MTLTDEYLVWSHEHGGWWRPGGWGYTKGLESAGRFSRDRALEICRNALPTAMHLGTISEIPVKLSDLKEVLDDQMVPSCILDDHPVRIR